MLPSATLGEKEVEGEQWFVGGREAYNQAEQVEFDKGSEWAQEVVEELVKDKDPVIWRSLGSMYGRARGEAVEQL